VYVASVCVMNKIDKEYHKTFTQVSVFLGLHFSELLKYAQKGYATHGRGYLNCVFASFMHMKQGDTIHVSYHNSKCTSITNIKEHEKLVQSYKPEYEFVLLIACPIYDAKQNNSRYHYRVMCRDQIIGILCDDSIRPSVLQEFTVPQACKDNKNLLFHLLRVNIDLFDTMCSLVPQYRMFSSMIFQDLSIEPMQTLISPTTTTSTALSSNDLIFYILGGKTGSVQFTCVPCKKKWQLRDMKTCSSCKIIWYCSKKCQEEHWKQHKQECNK
jgi:hypothetical protein